MSLKAAVESHRKAGPPSLTGSDVKSDITKITITAVELTGPEMNSPLKVEFKPPIKSIQPERGTISTYYPNLSSTRSLIKMYGDEERKLIGKSIRLLRIPRINPQTHQQTMGLQVMEEKRD